MFEQQFVDQIARAVALELRKMKTNQPERWPEVMSIETAAKYLDRTPEGIRHLIDAREVPTFRIDRRVQLRRVDLDRLVERHTK